MVACLDDEIGRWSPRSTKRMRDNTLILFHSDNGGTRNAMFAGVMADMSKVKSRATTVRTARARARSMKAPPALRAGQLACSH
jgi:arylsulfatase A-like enzyme